MKTKYGIKTSFTVDGIQYLWDGSTRDGEYRVYYGKRVLNMNSWRHIRIWFFSLG